MFKKKTNTGYKHVTKKTNTGYKKSLVRHVDIKRNTAQQK